MNFIAERARPVLDRHERRGGGAALLMALAGFTSLSFGDAIVKSMSGEWPGVAVGALRYTIGATALAAIVAARHGRRAFAVPQPWLQFGRGAAVAIATICFFTAVMHMPLADATAIQFTSPLLTAVLAALFLRERPRLLIWAGIALGSAGVALVLRPNFAALGPLALLPLGTALGMAVLIMLNRRAAGSAPALVMQFLFAAMAAPLLVLAALVFALLDPARFAIEPPGLDVIVKCVGIAVTGTLGHLLIYAATERAAASTIAPMAYIQLVAAGMLGWFWFGESPHLAQVGGAVLIVLAGLLVWRETRRSEGGSAVFRARPHRG